MIPSDLIKKGLFWTKGVMLVTGCTKCSEGCARCWSEKAHARRQEWPPVRGIYNPDLTTDGRFNGKVQFNLRLLEAAAKARKPQDIAIWNDLYHEGVTLEQQLRAFSVMRRSPQHTYLIVTKRPENALRFIGHWGLAPDPVTGFTGSGEVIPDNIWHIVTAENQARADERIPHLLRIPGKRGIIIEPMLGAVDVGRSILDSLLLDCRIPEKGQITHNTAGDPEEGKIHQVILGGETGTGARPMHPDWARSVRDQCAAAGVPFFFKSWGEWLPNSHWSQEARQENWKRLQWGTLTQDGTYFNTTTPFNGHDDDGHGGEAAIWRVGKERAGRLLDGREHNALAWNVQGE